MKKWYAIGGVAIVIIVIAFLFFRTSSNVTEKPNFSQTPSEIEFRIEKYESDVITADFLILDETGGQIVTNGTLDIEIIAYDGTKVYNDKIKLTENNFAVKKTDPKGKGLIYFSLIPAKIEIRKNEMLKSVKDSGKLIIKFATENGNVLATTQNFFGIPIYTKEEIQGMYDEEYLENSKRYVAYQTINDVRITLMRGGYYKTNKWNYPGPDIVFRMDISIENVGTEIKSTEGEPLMIVDGTQYNFNVASGSLWGAIYPGASKIAILETPFNTKIPTDWNGKIAKVVLGAIYREGETKNFEYTITLESKN